MTEVSYNSILIIINKFIKAKIFILYKEASTAEDLIYVFLRWIVAEHELLLKIISDRNKLIILKFWTILIA